jgi:GNAT superfamily N-acetyltransferase
MTENAPPKKPFCITRETTADSAAATAGALSQEVAALYGPRDESGFSLAARDGDGVWIGGMVGVIHWRWLYVRQFFVAPDWRRQGLGRALLGAAERLAQENACAGIYLDTFDRGALAFYGRCGFALAGQIDNFPPGAARYFLSRDLP